MEVDRGSFNASVSLNLSPCVSSVVIFHTPVISDESNLAHCPAGFEWNVFCWPHDWYPHERICLFISAERSLLCAERVEDRWRTFLFTLWLRSVNNSLHCWCSAYPKTVHIKRICLQSEQFTHSVTFGSSACFSLSLCVQLFCLWPTHTLTSTSLLYGSPSPLAFSHDSCFNHFLPAWTP